MTSVGFSLPPSLSLSFHLWYSFPIFLFLLFSSIFLSVLPSSLQTLTGEDMVFLPNARPFLPAPTMHPTTRTLGCCGELGRVAGSSAKKKLRLKSDLIYLTKSTKLLWDYFVITKVLFVFKFAVYPLCIYFTYLGLRSLGKLNSTYESPRFHEVPEKHF